MSSTCSNNWKLHQSDQDKEWSEGGSCNPSPCWGNENWGVEETDAMVWGAMPIPDVGASSTRSGQVDAGGETWAHERIYDNRFHSLDPVNGCQMVLLVFWQTYLEISNSVGYKHAILHPIVRDWLHTIFRTSTCTSITAKAGRRRLGMTDHWRVSDMLHLHSIQVPLHCLNKTLNLGNVYDVYKQDIPEINMYMHLPKWVSFLEHRLGHKLALDDFVFPYFSPNGIPQPKRPMTHDMVQTILTKFADAAGLTKTYTTHCFRRGGAQYWFMFAPIGKCWSLSIICWWGGWAIGEHVGNNLISLWSWTLLTLNWNRLTLWWNILLIPSRVTKRDMGMLFLPSNQKLIKALWETMSLSNWWLLKNFAHSPQLYLKHFAQSRMAWPTLKLRFLNITLWLCLHTLRSELWAIKQQPTLTSGLQTPQSLKHL